MNMSVTILKFIMATWMLAMAGCAGGARVSNMTAPTVPGAAPASEQSAFFQELGIDAVRGGERTNPLWVSKVGNAEFEKALRLSLITHGLYARDVEPRYLLSADLQAVEQPLFGFDMTVTSTIRYEIRNRTNGDRYFDRTINASYTATVDDAFLGVKRLQLANEGAIRENMARFIAAVIEKGNRLERETGQ
jgi:hypothetical protein